MFINKSILKYYLFQAATFPGFIIPINVLYLIYHDLSFTEIALASIVTEVIVFISEIPTGYISDNIGRRNALVLSVSLYTIVRAAFVFASSFYVFVVLFGILGIAGTLQSGSVDAWLYETLDEQERAGDFTEVRGRGSAIRLWFGAVMMILGAILYTFQPEYPYIAATIISAVGILVLITLPKNAQYVREQTNEENLTTVKAFSAIYNQLSTPHLRYFVIYIGLFFAIAYSVNEYTQPVTVEALDLILKSSFQLIRDTSEEILLGGIFALFSIATAFASEFASNIEDFFGQRRVFFAIPVIASGIIVLSNFVSSLIISVFFVTRLSNSIIKPISARYINDRIKSFGRATVLSAVALVYAAIRIPFLLIGGRLADVRGPVFSIFILGFVFLAITIPSYVVYFYIGD